MFQYKISYTIIKITFPWTISHTIPYTIGHKVGYDVENCIAQ